MGVGVWRIVRPLPGRAPAVASGPAVPAAPLLPRLSEAQILADRPDRVIALRFAANPRVLVLDFPDLRSQGRALNRVAAFAEKSGCPHDRVLTSAELDAAIAAHGDTVETFYYGHDYAAATLRHFFATAERDNVALYPEEMALRGVLAAQGLLDEGANAALITLPREGADPIVDGLFRRVILRHELSHGEYFTNPEYAAYVRHFWADVLDQHARDGFARFLAQQDYDPALQDLTINEMQAFLMHTHDARAFTPDAVGMDPATLARWQARFLAGMPAGWLRDATVAP